MKALYEAYKDKAVILVVYIREAHPAQPDQTAENAGWKATLLDPECMNQANAEQDPARQP